MTPFGAQASFWWSVSILKCMPLAFPIFLIFLIRLKFKLKQSLPNSVMEYSYLPRTQLTRNVGHFSVSCQLPSKYVKKNLKKKETCLYLFITGINLILQINVDLKRI